MGRFSAALLVLLAACTSQPAQSLQNLTSPSPVQSAPSPSPTPSTSPTATSQAPHVFVIVMENKSPDEALQGVYTARLASRFARVSSYAAVSHPSLPNYLALTSGSTWGITDDGYHQLPAGGLGDQLTAAGIDWAAFMEGMSTNCLDESYPYALKHDPFAYYGGSCPSEVVGFQTLDPSQFKQFNWISPGLCHDEHDCSVDVGDQWLSEAVPEIQSSPQYKDNGILFITWDEDDGSSTNEVLTIVASSKLDSHQIQGSFDHYSLLATIEDLYGLKRLGQAAGATPIPLS